ncbi:MAG: RNA methyltransferase [Candidatus Micrarchaeaceae archaeon]|jgi:TrmH family RNA methyltransferase
MLRLEVAVMEPKYQQNLGYIARVCKNFGIEELVLINPRCNHRGREAVKYSKHAADLLRSAKIIKGIKGLDSDLLIGTTGIWHKSNASYYNIYSLSRLSGLVRRALSARKNVTLLLGRDDTGLSRDELRLCDASVFIGAGEKYPILNISHALAVILNSLVAQEGNAAMKGLYAEAREQEALARLFESSLRGRKRIRDKKSVAMAFRHVIRRSVPTKKELNALSIAFAKP